MNLQEKKNLFFKILRNYILCAYFVLVSIVRSVYNESAKQSRYPINFHNLKKNICDVEYLIYSNVNKKLSNQMIIYGYNAYCITSPNLLDFSSFCINFLLLKCNHWCLF